MKRRFLLLSAYLFGTQMRVWWDKKCLEPGVPWEAGFCRGLIKSRSFLPIVSPGACGTWDQLAASSPCDNVLLEYRLALELQERSLIERVFPLFLGRRSEPAAGAGCEQCEERYERYEFSGPSTCHPTCVPKVAVDSVELALHSMLEHEGLGLPLLDGVTVADVLKGVCKFQGFFVEGTPSEVLEGLSACLGSMVDFLQRAEPHPARLPS